MKHWRHARVPRSRTWIAIAAVLGLLAVAAPTPAGPEGAVIRRGNVLITDLGNGRWLIQASNGAIIDYTRFNIGRGERVDFIQPGSRARVLNRISGDFGSTRIRGRLNANGIVYFVNPAGVFFQRGAVVDVGGIYAAAGTLTDREFLRAVRAVTPASTFTDLRKNVVVQRGATIRGDMVHLIGKRVRNRGVIETPSGGVVTMLSGNQVQIIETGGRVRVRIDGTELTTDLRSAGGGKDIVGGGGRWAVENTRTGVIDAPNGQVVLGAGDLFSLAVRNQGLIDASDGRVQMQALGGRVHHDGDMVSHDLYMSGDSLLLDENVRADIARFNDPVLIGSDLRIFDQDQTGPATDVLFVSTLDSEDGENNILIIESDETTFADHVGSNDRLGGLSVFGDATIGGDVFATSGLLFDGGVTLEALVDNGDQILDAGAGSLQLLGDVHKTDSGDLRLAGDAGVVVDGAIRVDRGGLTIEDSAFLNGGLVRTRDAQQYLGSVRLGRDIRMISTNDGLILFAGTLDGGHRLRTSTGGITRFDGRVGGNAALRSLMVDGRSQIRRDLTVTDRMSFGDAVQLLGNVRLTSGRGGIGFDGTIDGPFALTIRSRGDLRFGDDIGATTRLSRFDVASDGFILFDGASQVRTTGDIVLNGGGRGAVPDRATIGATGDLRFHSLNGDFVMGRREKMTVLGDLEITLLGSTAFLSDINTLGNLVVNADAIRLLTRAPGFVVDANGNRIFDAGLDFVAGGRFFFSTAPVLDGGGTVLFASAGGAPDARGTLGGFELMTGVDVGAFRLRPLSGPVAGQFLDLAVVASNDGSVATDEVNLAEAFADDAVLDEQSDTLAQSVTLDPVTRSRLEQDLFIQPRSLTAEEARTYTTGSTLYLNAGQPSIDPAVGHRVVINRLLYREVMAALRLYDQLVTPDRSLESIRSDLAAAWRAYRADGGATAAGFVEHVRQGEGARLVDELRLLGRILERLQTMGLTAGEATGPQRNLLNAFRPPEIDLPSMQAIVGSADAAATE